MNLHGKLTSLINYRCMIGFRANNRQHVIGAFCNFHVSSKQRETNDVRVKAAVSGEDRCVTTLIAAAKETNER